MAGVLKHQWIPSFREVFRVLKPGIGWVQCTEFQGNEFISENGTLPEDSAFTSLFVDDPH